MEKGAPPNAVRFRGAIYRIAAAQPYFQHDCDECIYLGSAVRAGDGARADFYLHDAGEERPAAIVRWSSNPSSNSSFPVKAVLDSGAQVPGSRYVFWRAFYEAYKKPGQ
jgi:hypothetical protein